MNTATASPPCYRSLRPCTSACLVTIESHTHARDPLFVNNSDGNTVSQP